MDAMQGEAAGNLKLYVDLLSQPCRAVVIFCRANEINAEEVIVQLRSRETRTAEYLRINPLGTVPSIDDGGFKLSESHAILRYLATTRDVADHWYPKDAKRRALIDSVLDWHHLNLHRNVVLLSVHQVFAKLPNLPDGVFDGLSLVQDEAESEKLLKIALDQLEMVFLQEGKFLANAEKVSIADLSLVCELKQLLHLDSRVMTDLLGSRKKITAWMDAVEETTNPHFASATTELLRFVHDIKVNRVT